jgi:hypothetical protein
MRLSLDRMDRGYCEDAWRVKQVLLDGIPVDDVLTADEEEGFITVIVHGEDGEPVVNDQDPVVFNFIAGYIEETRRGKVEIVMADKPFGKDTKLGIT